MNIPWYLSRSAGLVAYLLLFLTVCLGISIRTRGLDRVFARWKITDIHIFLSLLTLGFVLFHAIVLLWDGFVGYSLADIAVPFSTSNRSAWTAVGIATFYLLAVILLSFPARRFIGYYRWRALHYLTFLAYIGALLHGMFTGTDSRVAWPQLVYIGTAVTVLVLVILRIANWGQRAHSKLDKVARAAQGPDRLSAVHAVVAKQQAIESRALGFGAGAIVLAFFVFVVAGLGPFRWFHSTANGADATASQGDSSAAANPAPGNGFTDTFSGTASQQGNRGQIDFQMEIAASGQQDVRVDVALSLQATSSGRSQATANSLTMTDLSGRTICAGEVRQLDDQELVGLCDGSGAYAGEQLTLVAQFDTGLSDQVSGTLQAIVGQ
jgi:sulfoxide reductase heme-binding subunit YedZ